MTDFEEDGEEEESESEWQQELQRRYEQDANFMAELRARHPTSPPGKLENNTVDVDGTDQLDRHSKTAETLQWEEAVKRWVNR